MGRGKKDLFQLEKLLTSLVSIPRQLGNFLTARRLQAIRHLPTKEKLIETVFKNCVIIFLMIKRSKKTKKIILSTLESLQKNKWMIFLDKLSMSNDQSMLTTYLFKTLVQESILKEKGCQQFWTPVYKELSEKLSLPIEIDCVDLGLNSSNNLSQKQEEKSQSLKITRSQHHKKSLQTISSLSSTFSLVGKWGEEVTQKKNVQNQDKQSELRTVMIKIKPSKIQIEKIKEIFDVTRYLYNKVNSVIKKDLSLREKSQLLRDKYVTAETKKFNKLYEQNKALKKQNTENEKLAFSENEHLLFKYEKIMLSSVIKKETNTEIRDFEISVSKSIRDNTIRNICANYKSAVSNLKNGNIKFFDIGYKKKSDHVQCFKLAKNDIKINSGKIRINPDKLDEQHCSFKFGKRNSKKYGSYIIENGCDFIKNQSGYYIGLVLPTVRKENKKFENFCGVDPGVRTLLTCYGSNGVEEYTHNSKALDKLNYLIHTLKTKRTKRTRKKKLSKLDKKKKNYIDDIHWKSITNLLKTNDVIFFGDIKSHGIVKNGKNKTLNRNFNDLKFYLFKQRLKYKALLLNKKVIMVHEAYTTQGCSCCGNLWKTIGSEKVYKCSKCKSTFDRDVNSAKNILMKGLLSC